jgi:predicted nucleic acid-binding Zn ribbon protein
MKVVKGNRGTQGPQAPQSQAEQQMQVKVALKDTTDLTCEQCDNKLFVQLMMFKKLSAVLSPTGEESLIPVQVFACNSCGHVNEQFVPQTGE